MFASSTIAPSCSPATPLPRSPDPLQELMRLLGVPDSQASCGLPNQPLKLRLAPGATLSHEGAEVDFIHVVRSGSFKCVRVLEDGYEQVLNFADRGDLLGFDGLCRGAHLTSVIALEDSTVYGLAVHELSLMRAQSQAFCQALQMTLGRQLVRAERTLEMMAAVSAETRLARFLVWQSEHMAERGESPRRFLLRMSRRDIASLLGVAHETVSRSFTLMVRAGLLRVDNREVEILDFEHLAACTRGTRGGCDDPLPRSPAGSAPLLDAA